MRRGNAGVVQELRAGDVAALVILFFPDLQEDQGSIAEMVAKPIDSDHQRFALRVRVVGRFFLRDGIGYQEEQDKQRENRYVFHAASLAGGVPL